MLLFRPDRLLAGGLSVALGLLLCLSGCSATSGGRSKVVNDMPPPHLDGPPPPLIQHPVSRTPAPSGTSTPVNKRP